MPVPWQDSGEESEAKRPRVSDTQTCQRQGRRSIQSAGGLLWSSADLALAATLLETPNARFPTITFSDLEEKRRVFTLVYDVLRYKSILNQALDDLYFFTRHSHMKEHCHLVWLLFFDLYKRDFSMRDALEPAVAAAFSRQGLNEIDEVLWQLRVKLAATVSRLRIKSGAHSLSQLLPRHLRLTRSALEENAITGWVNIFKSSVKETCHHLEKMGINPLPRDHEVLEPLTFKTDHLLPRFLHIMPNTREDVVNSPLVCDYHIIMQERTFCLGPAVVAQLLKDYALSGKVAQTHVNSPITMAYFANLLINNDKIEALLVFGAGYRKEACEQYLRDLGVKNTKVFSESFAGLSPDNRVLDNVIAVLATPPNTNSSVVDPVDLAVARGGDLQILQQLTDTDFSSTPRGEHINKFLKDQRDTLRRAMSKPQIQFVVYETHSRFACENEEMASSLVNELNNYAAEVHLEELRRSQGENQERERERSQAEPSDTPVETPIIKTEEELNLPIPPPVQTVVIPPSDLFEIADLPDLCPNCENCLDLMAEGSYVALIKRKEITRLDPKYMIQMAEARGLFGRPDGTPKTKPSAQTARAKAALLALQARSDAMAENSKSKVKVEMDRIAAPTRASLLRDIHPPSCKDCPRHTHHLAHDGTPMYLRELLKERKTYLTPHEEEELIRRLYTCPKVHVFPPRLYEDLPSLKFWNSPASVIESYLQRKVFQKRLQLAYEFNQNKDSNLNSTKDSSQEAKNKLTQAISQLTSDMNFFQHLASQQVLMKAHERELVGVQASDECQNKALWSRIFPEQFTSKSEFSKESVESINKIFWDRITQENYSTGEKSIDMKRGSEILKDPLKEQNLQSKLLVEIRKKYLSFKDFYRLQNLNCDSKEPLAVTIGTHHRSSTVPQTESSDGTDKASLYKNSLPLSKDEHNNDSPSTMSKKVVMKYPSTFELESRSKLKRQSSSFSSSRLQKVQYSPTVSFDGSLNIKRKLQYLLEMENKERESNVGSLSTASAMHDNFSRRLTAPGAKDSIELAHKKLSSSSKVSLSKNIKSKISFVSFNSHRDSRLLLFNKFLGKPKPKGVSAFFEVTKKTGELSEATNKSPKNIYSACSHSKPSFLTDHQDSIILASDRLNSKEKYTKSITCDICNNEYNPIQFSCNFHSQKFDVKSFNKQSIISSKRPFYNHKDSFELLSDKMSGKEIKTSVEIQAGLHQSRTPKQEESPKTCNEELLNQPELLLIESKQAQKMYNHRKNEQADQNSSTLNKYLMKSININQIIVNDNK